MNSKDSQQTLLPGVSHASLFPQPGSKEARTMTVTSGRRCYALYGSLSPLGSLVKMLLESSVWHSTKCLLTWKWKVTPANALLFQLAVSMPRTDETGSGLWPTPDTQNHRDGAKLRKDNNAAAGGKHGVSLHHAVKMWPTPRNCTAMAATVNPDAKFPNLETVVAKTGVSGQLNPAWVEWLMGYPSGWTDLEPSETP